MSSSSIGSNSLGLTTPSPSASAEPNHTEAGTPSKLAPGLYVVSGWVFFYQKCLSKPSPRLLYERPGFLRADGKVSVRVNAAEVCRDLIKEIKSRLQVSHPKKNNSFLRGPPPCSHGPPFGSFPPPPGMALGSRSRMCCRWSSTAKAGRCSLHRTRTRYSKKSHYQKQIIFGKSIILTIYGFGHTYLI